MDKTLNRIFSLLPHKPDGKLVHGAKKELADKLGLESSVLTQWETGRNHSYTRYLYQIAALYGVSVSWLSGDTDDPAPAPAPAPAPVTLSREEIKRLVLDLAPQLTDAEILDLVSGITAAHENKKEAEKRES